MKAAPIRVVTDAIEGVAKTYYGKLLTYKSEGQRKGTVTDIVEVTVGPMRYHVAPKGPYSSVWSANSDGGWYVVGDPQRTRRSVSAAARKGAGMTAWEKVAIDKAVEEVLSGYVRRGATPTLLAEDLFYNWGMGMHGRFLDYARQEQPDGTVFTQQARKVQYSKTAQVSAVAASLSRLVKAKRASIVYDSGLRGGEVKTYIPGNGGS